MKKSSSLLAGLGLACACAASWAQTYTVGELAVDHPYARATGTGQPAGGAYLRVANRGARPDRLVSASADVSKTVELHQMQMQGDVMRMRQVEAVDIPPNQVTELRPGGLHIMLMGLKRPLKEGERFPMTLKFEKAGEVKVDMVVEAVKSEPMKHDMKDGMKH
jgi:copper(I)-binding protein